MANVSPSLEALHVLVSGVESNLEAVSAEQGQNRVDSDALTFDPTQVSALAIEDGERRLFLRSTHSLVGRRIAVYDQDGPSITKGKSDPDAGLIHTENIIHPACDYAVLQRTYEYEALRLDPAKNVALARLTGLTEAIPARVI